MGRHDATGCDCNSPKAATPVPKGTILRSLSSHPGRDNQTAIGGGDPVAGQEYSTLADKDGRIGGWHYPQ
ncbi:hypothetical protein J4727_17995 [Providencia rettgeri]|uniref:Uncharacterized protein n=1 Tax=Providencia rettgeri TaxID=587 RepID=A0A939NC25_PRORE|nr:hypothetical protein [Providencia rettgeri]